MNKLKPFSIKLNKSEYLELVPLLVKNKMMWSSGRNLKTANPWSDNMGADEYVWIESKEGKLNWRNEKHISLPTISFQALIAQLKDETVTDCDQLKEDPIIESLNHPAPRIDFEEPKEYKAGDYFPDWKKLKALPKDIHSASRYPKKGDLFVYIAHNTKCSIYRCKLGTVLEMDCVGAMDCLYFKSDPIFPKRSVHDNIQLAPLPKHPDDINLSESTKRSERTWTRESKSSDGIEVGDKIYIPITNHMQYEDDEHNDLLGLTPTEARILRDKLTAGIEKWEEEFKK